MQDALNLPYNHITTTYFCQEKNNQKNEKYEKVSKIFEKIYWLNPNLIEHIELNLRSLIKAYSKEFEKYILARQKEVKSQNDIKNYDDCVQKLQKAYLNLKMAEEETVSDIVVKANNGATTVKVKAIIG